MNWKDFTKPIKMRAQYHQIRLRGILDILLELSQHRAAYTSMNDEEDGTRSRRGQGSNPPSITKAQFGGLSSENLRPTAGPVKKMRPMNRGPSDNI